MKLTLASTMLLAASLGFAAQAQTPPPPAQGQPGQDMNVQFLGEMLRSATNMHDVVRNMQLDPAFTGRDQDTYLPPAERQRRQLARTAAIMGAGAGAGVAIGSMAHSEKGLLIGALIGSAGGLVIDQILRHRAEHPRSVSGPSLPPPHELRERDHYRDRDYDRDRDRFNEPLPQQ